MKYSIITLRLCVEIALMDASCEMVCGIKGLYDRAGGVFYGR
jgi:hypothetical protein